MAIKKQYNLYNKIRAALRDIYRYSPMRKEAIKLVTVKSGSIQAFTCPICQKHWPIQMADVDHEPPLGPLLCLSGGESTALGLWAHRLFFGNVQVICKLCHKKKTAFQRRKHAIPRR